VKLLFDENLSLGLGQADDATISTFARDHDYMVGQRTLTSAPFA